VSCDIQAVFAAGFTPSGRYRRIVKQVISGYLEERTYILRNLTREQLVATIRAEIAAGATFNPRPSLDQRRLVTKADLP